MNRAQVLALLVLMLFGRLAGADERRPAEAGPPDWARVSRLQIAAARELGVPVAIENDMGMRFVLIPAGTFRMGCAAFEPGSPLGFDNPQHTVELTEPFYLQITEVTNAQYRRFQPGHDSGSVSGGSLNGDNQPVVRVSWMDALKFAHWLSARDGARRYEVPSEARWEYACRAGRSALCSTSDAITAEVANVDGRPDHVFRGRSVDVANFAPSAWGLYDMDGNVSEYCSSWYSTYPRSSVVVDPLGALHRTQGRAVRGGALLGVTAFRRFLTSSRRAMRRHPTPARVRCGGPRPQPLWAL